MEGFFRQNSLMANDGSLRSGLLASPAIKLFSPYGRRGGASSKNLHYFPPKSAFLHPCEEASVQWGRRRHTEGTLPSCYSGQAPYSRCLLHVLPTCSGTTQQAGRAWSIWTLTCSLPDLFGKKPGSRNESHTHALERERRGGSSDPIAAHLFPPPPPISTEGLSSCGLPFFASPPPPSSQ